MGIIVKAWTPEGENGLFQVDINTGNYKKLKIENIPDLKNWQIYWNWKEPQFSPDRKIIYYTTAVDSVSPGEPLNLIAYSVDKGTEKIIHRFEKEISQRTISPDGRFIAFSHFFSDKNSLYVIPVEGQGLEKKIAGFEGDFVVKAIGWTPDNNKVLFTRQSSIGDVEIWAASLENEPPVKLYNADALKAFKGAVDLKIQYVGNDAYLTMKDAGSMNELWAADNITQK
jgi:WD40 repeat protein